MLYAAGAALATPPARHALASAAANSDHESARALHALNRLAYGPRPDDLAAIRREGAQAWLASFLAVQLEPQSLALPAPLQARLDGLDTQQLSQAELLARFRRVLQVAGALPSAGQGAPQPEELQASARREYVRPVVLQAAEARLVRAIESPAQLHEVLVAFWFNHFNVFVGKGPVSVLAGAYEREAIRPHVLGRFRNLLGATAKHPAMLVYLDNAQSVRTGFQTPAMRGPFNPSAAQLRGLNENYARELMELHTLGVDGGYTQHDVSELARIFTGWTVDQRGARSGRPGSLFVFDPGRHDTGTKHWLGHTVYPEGQAEGEMALDVLAAHPSTARHVGFKLAQAFVADQPPQALVTRLANRFLASEGDLKAVTRELVTADEFWQVERFGAKFKTPYHYLISSLRALGAATPPDVQPLLQVLAQAGMPLYGAPTPDGYRDVASAWMNPEALVQRVQFATSLSARRARQGERPEADALRLLDSLGPLLGAATRETVAAEPVSMRLALLLSSPEFMRR